MVIDWWTEKEIVIIYEIIYLTLSIYIIKYIKNGENFFQHPNTHTCPCKLMTILLNVFDHESITSIWHHFFPFCIYVNLVTMLYLLFTIERLLLSIKRKHFFFRNNFWCQLSFIFLKDMFLANINVYLIILFLGLK